MSSLSGGTKEIITSYIKLIIYQSQLCENSLNIKNIFPYGISIQFDNNPETFIEPIKNINEIFNSSQNDFKYFINNRNKKHLIKINCYTKSLFIIKKKLASVKIAVNINNINKNEKEKRVKKWYYLKNKNGEVIIKLLLSLDILNISNIIGNDNNKIFLYNLQNETELDNNISINKPNNINVHFNSISNNNLNGIGSTTYMSTSHYISSSNNSLKSSSTKTNNSNLSNHIIINQNNNVNNRTISNNNINLNNNNLLSSIIEKDDSMTINENETNEKFEFSNNILNVVQNLIKKNNQKLFIKSKNLMQKKQYLGKEENNYFKTKKNYEEKINKYKNNIKILDTKRQIYENNFIDLTENYNKYEKNIYKLNIENDLNIYEKEMLLNINNICITQNNLEEIILEEKMSKNYFGQYSMTNNLKENEKSVINNYYNSKGYSFESNNYKNSLYLYGNGGNSNKVLFNIMFDNKSINNNHFNIKPSPISFKYKEINNELSVSMSNSNSPSSEKNYSNKKRLITDYSRSTFNILDDLYIFEDVPDIIRNKGSKSNNIVQNHLALNIDDTLNNKNNIKNNKKNNKVLQNNNKKNSNHNLISNRKKAKKIKINDDNENSYYHLEEKYYTITEINNKSKNKDINVINKKIIPKKVNNKKDIKDIDVKKSYDKNLNSNNNIINKISYKSIIFKQKIDINNSTNKNENKIKNNKNILQNSTKNENKNNIFHGNTNNKKNNRVFKNVLIPNKNNKKKKISSIITENIDNKSINDYSLLGINSILPEKLISIDNNSRNVKYIQYNTNPNKNIKYKKINRNCINLQKKPEINIENDLINHFYYNNESNTKCKKNKKISFYINADQKKNTIDSACSTRIISKKNTTFNTYNKINNAIYYNLISKKTNNKINNNNNNSNSKNNIINKISQNRKNNEKKITNINRKITFFIRKNKTINDEDKKYNLNNNNVKKKVINNRNNEYSSNTLKNNKNNDLKNNKNKIKVKNVNNHNNCLINNNTSLKPLVNSNKNKNSFLSLFNNRYN